MYIYNSIDSNNHDLLYNMYIHSSMYIYIYIHDLSNDILIHDPNQ